MEEGATIAEKAMIYEMLKKMKTVEVNKEHKDFRTETSTKTLKLKLEVVYPLPRYSVFCNLGWNLLIR